MAVKTERQACGIYRTQNHTPLAHVDPPVEMKGSNLSIVSFKVREIKEVRWGLLIPGLPAEKRRGRVQGQVSLSHKAKVLNSQQYAK